MAKSEQGICILCGEEKSGTPLKADFIVSIVRKARDLLKMPAKRTVACKSCQEECRKKRGTFEKSRRNYQYAAAAFLLILVVGSVAYQNFDLRLAIPALIGTAFILCLPYAKYFPDFSFS
jgi:hypothetical protein